jgi:hypothetical protein
MVRSIILTPQVNLSGGFCMSRVILAVFLVIALVVSFVVPVFAGPPTHPQSWKLDSANDSDYPFHGNYQMEKVPGQANDGQSGKVKIETAGDGASFVIWLTDQAASQKVTFAPGHWNVELVTDNVDWYSDCYIDIGTYNEGSGFQSLGTTLFMGGVDTLTQDTPGGPTLYKYFLQIRTNTDAVKIYSGDYLALLVGNKSATDAYYIYTAQGGESSCLRSPQTDPGYPVPEMAAGLLMGAGVVGISGFILLRRRSSAATLKNTSN